MPHLFVANLLLNSRALAVLFGSVLGWIAWELSHVPEQTTYNFAMALIVIGAGSASFVLHALHLQAVRNRGATRDVLMNEARACLILLGGGIALSINALQFGMV